MSVLRTKSVEQSIADTDEPEFRLKKSLTALDLTVFGVGVVIGAGIFTLTGRAAHDVAGPAIVVSFVVAAIACALAALCYAEFASTVPVAGSAYTFSYSSLGELFAWIIGWDLILEMFLGASVVAQGWSAYLGTLLAQLGAPIPPAIGYGGTVDVMAILLVLVLGGLMTFGIKESLRVNPRARRDRRSSSSCSSSSPACCSSIRRTGHPSYRRPSPAEARIRTYPAAPPIPLRHRADGFRRGRDLRGGGAGFFAFIGFDAVATTAEETPTRSATCRSGSWLALI